MEEKQQTISVLISVYYKENPSWFARALRSITLEQTRHPDEVVLVADGPLTEELEEEIRKIYTGQKDIRTGLAAFITGVDRKGTEEYLQQYALAQDMIGALTEAAAAFRPGQALRPQAVSTAAEVCFCSNCGARVEGGTFCPDCGARL